MGLSVQEIQGDLVLEFRETHAQKGISDALHVFRCTTRQRAYKI